MKWFKITATVLFVSLNVFLINAQNCSGGKHEDFLSKLITEKSKYLQEKMGLTGKTAEDFSKMYYDMEMKKFTAVHEVYRKAKKLYRSETPINDADYIKSAEEQASVPVKTADIEYQFFNELKKVLSPEQLFLFYHWERRFGKEMIRKEQKK